MAEPPAVHAITVRFMPGQPDPVLVMPHCDPLPAEHVVGLLRRAAGDHARAHGLDSGDCLRDFLTTYPPPNPEGDPT